MIGTIILCTVASTTDADSLRCQDGRRIRIAAVSARERNGSCNSAPDCATMPHRQAQPIAEQLTLGRTIAFRVVGGQGKRFVGENFALRCQLIRSGAAVSWERWRVRYGLGRCR